MKKLFYGLNIVIALTIFIGVGQVYAFDDICTPSGTALCASPDPLTPNPIEDPLGNRTGDAKNSTLMLDIAILGEDFTFSPFACNDGLDNGPAFDGLIDGLDPDCIPPMEDGTSNPTVCFDGYDNGPVLDGLVDLLDPDCFGAIMPPPFETITLTGPVEIERYPSFGPDGMPGGGDDKLHAILGPGEHEIDTEIVSMNLTGFSMLLGTTLTISEAVQEDTNNNTILDPGEDRDGDGLLDTNQSTGKITTQSTSPSGATNFPADSFFDIYFDMAVTGFGGGFAAMNERSDGITRPPSTCSDGLDNDGDTFTDLADTDCSSGEPNTVNSIINKIAPLRHNPYEDPLDPSNPQKCANGVSDDIIVPFPYTPDALIDTADPSPANGGVNIWHCENVYKHSGVILVFLDIIIPNGVPDLGEPIVFIFKIVHLLPLGETSINLASFDTISGNGHINITWTTGSEIDNEGFNILRSSTSNGPFEKINPEMILAKGSSMGGATYEYVDTTVEDGKTYYYKIEDIDTRGKKEQSDPVAAVAGEIKDVNAAQPTNQSVEEQDKVAGIDKYDNSEGKKVLTEPITIIPGYTIIASTEELVKGLSDKGFDLDENQEVNLMTQKESQDDASNVHDNKNILNNPDQEDRTYTKDLMAPESIRFLILDINGNEIAVASIEEKSDDTTMQESGKITLQNQRGKDGVVLSWVAAEPVKGFHILRSNTEDGTYNRITKAPIPYIEPTDSKQSLHYTYKDKNVQKGNNYYYKLEIIPKGDNKTAKLH